MIYPSYMTNGKNTKNEIENVEYMRLHLLYKKNLEDSKKSKIEYLDLKNRLKTVKQENRESLEKLIEIIKNDAIEYWNKSQKYLAQSIEFESNRKYPNR